MPVSYNDFGILMILNTIGIRSRTHDRAIAHFIDRPDKQKPNITIDVGLLTFKAIDEDCDRSINTNYGLA